MKIVLVGYMGSGKSTVAKLLANAMKLKFLDLDNYIEQRLGSKIPIIFKERGELFFRKKEHEYLKCILDNENDLVLSVGGGTPCYAGNMDSIIEKADAVFYLKVSLPVLVQRLSKEKENRPLIKNIPDEDLPEFIGKHLFERSFYYSQATYKVLCDKKEPKTIVDEIQSLFI
ncbi:shikimate kinase [Costertonia aggregata]|uniref:Shikimate kinase n=1 Tax=Costertonia aggregata TaxID=343403 RepID=A0A7H9AL25_9FLAO|nr:shikimate kinase [Costertonia aggregata]QLG44160.1 AAA family ATPase [Costertonia aggregata]